MRADTSKNVLITFGRSFLTLHLARLLHAGGHRVRVADSLRFPITRFSNTVEEAFLVASPRDEPLAWAGDLARIARENAIDLVITIHEETDILADAVRRSPDLFPEGCELFLQDLDQVDRLDNKFGFQQLLEELGVPTLPHRLVSSAQDLADLDLPGPYALKQCYSRGSQEVYRVEPGRPPAVTFDAANPWFAQAWAEGPRFCSYSICRSGQVLAHSAYPVGYAIDGRSCLYYEQVRHDGVEQWVRDRVKAINFTGQIGFDFIETPDGLFAIECNPRATSGLLLFSPEDRVDRAFCDAVGPGKPVISPPAGTVRTLSPGMFIYGWRKSSLPGNTLRGFLRDARAAEDVITARADRRPMLALPIALGDIMFQGLRHRVPLPEAFMHDHEWHSAPPA